MSLTIQWVVAYFIFPALLKALVSSLDISPESRAHPRAT